MRSTSEDRSAITTAVRHAREALKKALWGAALATIGVLPAGLWWFGLLAHNFRAKLLSTPLLRTFASPRVGDPVFATNFNQIGITSWRIVNELDVVPNLPFLSFEHIQTLHLYNSASSVQWSLVCWHSLNTYLHLLDSSQPLSADCRWLPWWCPLHHYGRGCSRCSNGCVGTNRERNCVIGTAGRGRNN